MPAPADKPVFITDTPDYQEAVKKASELANYQAPLAAAAQELGLANELQQSKDALGAFQNQAQLLTANEKFLAAQDLQADRRNARTAKDVTDVGKVVTGTGALAGSAIMIAAMPKRWNALKGAASVFATGLATGIASIAAWMGAVNKVLSGGREEKAAIARDIALNQTSENQLTTQTLALQNGFIEQMATRMVEQQKALAGEGDQMKLVSTAQAPGVPSQTADETSMAGKYATPPAGSKVAALAGETAAVAAGPAR